MRLTETYSGGYAMKDMPMLTTNDGVDKLGQYEDIDDELGITYDVLFKALTKCIKVKVKHSNWRHNRLYPHQLQADFEDKCFRLWGELDDYDEDTNSWSDTGYYYLEDVYEFDDYGKTWVLIDEEFLCQDKDY